MVFSAPFQSIRIPPPPGFIPPPVPPVPPRPTVISVLNPFPKPSPNYKTNTNNLPETTTTKSILREPGCYSVKNVSDRVVSFDLESSAITTNTTMTKPINHAQRSLAPKCSNPSMPNLHYGYEKAQYKNPFLADITVNDQFANESEHDSSESQSDDDDDFDDFESAENTDLVLSDTTNINHNNKTVKLGENFFASLFNNTSFTNKIPDPWPATKSTEATAASSANATAWPTMTTASGTPAGQPQPGPHGLSPMTPANPSATQKSPTGSQSRPAESTAASVSVADRYSALKELDEIFKTTVTVSDGEFFGFFSTNKFGK